MSYDEGGRAIQPADPELPAPVRFALAARCSSKTIVAREEAG